MGRDVKIGEDVIDWRWGDCDSRFFIICEVDIWNFLGSRFMLCYNNNMYYI